MAALGTATASVGAASATIVPKNSTRHSLVVTNMSDEVIWLSEGQDAEANKGIPLAASADGTAPGGTYIRVRGSRETGMFIGDLAAISSGGASKTVAILELDFDDQSVYRA